MQNHIHISFANSNDFMLKDRGGQGSLVKKNIRDYLEML